MAVDSWQLSVVSCQLSVSRVGQDREASDGPPARLPRVRCQSRATSFQRERGAGQIQMVGLRITSASNLLTRPRRACPAGEVVLLARCETREAKLDPCRLVRQVKESSRETPFSLPDSFTCQTSWQGSNL